MNIKKQISRLYLYEVGKWSSDRRYGMGLFPFAERFFSCPGRDRRGGLPCSEYVL